MKQGMKQAITQAIKQERSIRLGNVSLLGCLLLSACSQTPVDGVSVTEESGSRFGDSVRAMVWEQTCIKNQYCTGSAGGRLEGWEAEQILRRYQSSSDTGGG